MLAIERHRRIVSIVDREGSARATELAKSFGVTQETIRLDLEKLESEGLLVRKHGGAVSVRSMQAEIPFAQRQIELLDEKAAIARKALELVQENDTILLDASSTAWQLGRMLPDFPITVVTNAVKIAVELAPRRNTHVILIGGAMAAPSLSLVGPLAERCLRDYHLDKLFLSCAGVDVERGASDGHEWQATLKRTMMECAEVKCLMVDHAKFNVRALSLFAPLDAFDVIITDSGANKATLAKMREIGLPIQVAAAGLAGE